MKLRLADIDFLDPRNLIPILVALVFSMAAIYTSSRFVDTHSEGFLQYQSKNRVLLEFDEALYGFELTLLDHLAGTGKARAEEVRERSRKLNESYEVLVGNYDHTFDAQMRLVSMNIRDEFAQLSYLLEKGDDQESRKRIVVHLEELHRKLTDFFGFLERHDHSDVSSSHAGRMQHHHAQVFWSVFTMGLSGFVLIIVLVDRLGKLRRIDDERRQALELVGQRMAAIESAFDGICITDADGILTYANRALAEYYGYDGPDELMGQSWRVLYDGAQCDWFESEVVPQLGNEEGWHGHSIGLRKDGTTFFQNLSVKRMPDGGMVRVMRDVTDQMQSEALSKRRLAAIEAAGDGIGIVGSDGNLSYMNKALMALHGIPEEDLPSYIGSAWGKLYTEKGRAQIEAEMLPVLEKTGYWRGESPIVRTGGDVIWAEMSLTRLPDGGFIGTARDISERKKAEKEKQELQEQVYQAQKMEAVGRLAGGIAHDFNNILAAMLGYAEFLEEDLEDDPQMKKFATNIITVGGQAKALVDQMLAFSRRSESVKEIMDLKKVVSETVSMLKASLPKAIEVHVDVKVPGAKVYANATQMTQALMNLCVNARDAMGEKHGELTVCLDLLEPDDEMFEGMMAGDMPDPSEVVPLRIYDLEPGQTYVEVGTLQQGRPYYCLSVTDTGTGIEREVMEKMFDPFFTTKAVNKGTGLGLSNVHGIIAAHGGAITIDSTIGEGTCFSFYIPLAEEQGATDEKELEAEEDFATGSGRILIVEDQEQVREMIQTMLSRLGYECSVCTNGLEAREHLKDHGADYDLVLTDHNMPKMTGLELIEHTYKTQPDIPFVLLSGYGEERMQEMIEPHPAIKASLRKPVNKKKLAEEISRVVSEGKAAA